MTTKEDKQRQITIGKKLKETAADQLNQKKIELDNVKQSFFVPQDEKPGWDLVSKDITTEELGNMDVAPMNVPKSLGDKRRKSWRYRSELDQELNGTPLDNLRNSHFNFELIQNIAAPRLGSVAQSRPGKERFRDSARNFDVDYRNARLYNRQARRDQGYRENIRQRT